jgi:hypothetical protein
MSLIRTTVCVFAFFALAACAVTHETSVLVGTPRAPTTPEQVKLYTSPPKKYTEIALISADAAHDFMEKQALLDTAVLNAKKQAAKVGANGILLDGLGDFQVGSSGVIVMQPSVARGAPAIGTGSANVRTGKQVSGKAIYVTEE